jgi:ATP-binding cassette subfamily B protein
MKKISSLRSRAKEYIALFKESNKTVGEIDPVYRRYQYISFVTRGVSSIGGFAVIAGVFHEASSKYSDVTKIPRTYVVGGLLIFLAYHVLVAVFKNYSHMRYMLFIDKAETYLERKRTEKIMQMDSGRLNDPQFIRVSKIGYSTQNAILEMFEAQGSIISVVVSFFASIFAFAFINGWLALFVVISVIPGVLKAFYFNKKELELRERKVEPEKRKDAYLRILTHEDPSLQARLGRYVLFTYSKYSHASYSLLRFAKKLYSAKARIGTFTDSFQQLVMILIIGYIALSFSSGGMTISGIIIVIGALSGFARSVASIGDSFSDSKKHVDSYEKYLEFLETQPLIDETCARKIVLEETPEIILRNVSFMYPRTEQYILRNISLAIPPRQKVALVGHNGCGKSTILKLLSKTYLANEGQVALEDIPIENIRQDSWLDQVVYITQDCELPEFTIKEALSGEVNPDVGFLRESASVLNVDSIVYKHPAGYDSQIGAGWKNGIEFSGGEHQRLKLASAFHRIAKGGIKVVLFDEPMAGCDIQTDQLFYNSLINLKEQTVVVVIHNPNYLHCFDRVIEMKDGRIVKDLTSRHDILEYQENVLKSIKSIKSNQVSEQFSLAV